MVIVCGLAVYKVVQLLEALLPREVMPWVKILFTVLTSLLTVTFVTDMENEVLNGFAVATVAGATHTLLRMLTLGGDYFYRKSVSR